MYFLSTVLCYQPPNPIHSVDSFLSMLPAVIERTVLDFTSDVTTVAGYFNALCTDCLAINYGQLTKFDQDQAKVGSCPAICGV
jgi:hypothetical protein